MHTLTGLFVCALLSFYLVGRLAQLLFEFKAEPGTATAPQQLLRLMIAVSSGFCLVTLGVTYLSYLGVPAATYAKPLFAGLCAIWALLEFRSVRLRPKRSRPHFSTPLMKSILGLFAITALGVGLMSYPYVKERAWFPFGDHFTYLSTSQYFRAHSYYEMADPSAQQWLSHVWLYQECKLRIGSQMMMGFIAELFGTDHVFFIYPMFLALAEALFLWNICLFIFAGLGLSFGYGLLGAAFCLFSIVFNLQSIGMGFLPQAFGLSALLFATTFQLRLLRSKKWLTNGALTTLGFGALAVIYQEILPFAIAGVGCICLFEFNRLSMQSRRFDVERLSFFASRGMLPIATSFVFFPVSAYYAVMGILTQMKGVVGGDQAYDVMTYVRDIFGQASPEPLQSLTMRLRYALGNVMAWVLCLMAIQASTNRRNQKSPVLLGLVAAPIVALFVFTYLVRNPFDPSRIGHTWNIYKLVSWYFWWICVVFAVLASQLIGDKPSRRRGAAGIIACAGIILCFATGYGRVYAEWAHGMNTPMRQMTGVDEHPVDEYFKLRALHSNYINKPGPILFTGIPVPPPATLLTLDLLEAGRADWLTQLYRGHIPGITEDRWWPRHGVANEVWIHRSVPFVTNAQPTLNIAGFKLFPAGTVAALFHGEFSLSADRKTLRIAPSKSIETRITVPVDHAGAIPELRLVVRGAGSSGALERSAWPTPDGKNTKMIIHGPSRALGIAVARGLTRTQWKWSDPKGTSMEIDLERSHFSHARN